MSFSSFSVFQWKKPVVILLLLTGAAQLTKAQGFSAALERVDQPWYAGVSAGSSFGQATFRSVTEHQFHMGAQGGFWGGYRMNRLISFEAGLQFGRQTQTALDCCPYWLSESGERYIAPVYGMNGWAYRDLRTRTGWGKLLLQANFDAISLFKGPDCKWSASLSPQISVVTTRTLFLTPGDDIRHDRQWHMGLGGQASVGYEFKEGIVATAYTGITCLTGQRFDNIPEHCHKSNLIYDAGVKLTIRWDILCKGLRL